ncbi:MAG: MinD/ParA family protein [Oscillospiraceae bacterium]|jgi:flagellar biosynthesis protein FlhG|nr:MinD/ParA family protein [Oscillospiraceae bacterium]
MAMMDQAQNLRDRVKKPRQLKVVTVASGKGGVGKSTVSANLAIALSRLKLNVLVLDADFGLSNIDIMFGVVSNYNLSHFLSGERGIAEIMQKGPENVWFISGGAGLNELLTLKDAQIMKLMQGLGSLSPKTGELDYIICDIGAGINENNISMILASSETIVVTTPEPTSIVDAYALVKTVSQREPSHRIHVVMNKSDSIEEAKNVMLGFSNVVYNNLSKRISPLGYILFDDSVPKSIKTQTPITIAEPNGVTARSIVSIAQKLSDITVERAPQGKLASLFSRVFSGRR